MKLIPAVYFPQLINFQYPEKHVIGIIGFIPGAIGVSEIRIAALLSQLGFETVIAQTGAMMTALYSLVILILSVIHLIILKSSSIKLNNL